MDMKISNYLLAIVLLLGTTANGIVLRIEPTSNDQQQLEIAANFPFSPELVIEVIDSNNMRITSGDAASLGDEELNWGKNWIRVAVEIRVKNAKSCLVHGYFAVFYYKKTVEAEISDPSFCFADHSFTLVNGSAAFPGSVCEPTNGVSITLQFKATYGSTALATANTKAFTVTNDIWLAYFAENSRYRNGYYEQFLRDGVQDVNNNHFDNPVHLRTVLAGRVLNMRSYYYNDGTPGNSFNAWKEMTKFNRANPSKKAHALIGFSNNEVSKVLLPLTVSEKIAVTSYREDVDVSLGDKTKYPYFNRIHYPQNLLEYAFALYLKERKWIKIVVIADIDNKMNSEFYNYANDLGIQIMKEYTVHKISGVNGEPAGGYASMLEEIKNIGVRLIVNTVRGKESTYLYMEALDVGMTATAGYQWVGYKNKIDFPDTNYPTRCQKTGSFCNFAFKGATFFDAAYLIDGGLSNEWLSILAKFYDQDKEKSLGHHRDLPKNFFEFLPLYGLVYDALKTNVYAMERLIAMNKTISGENLANEIRNNTDFYGLTKRVKLEPETGIRLDFTGYASVNWPNADFFNGKFSVEILTGAKKLWDYSDLDVVSVNTLFVMGGSIGSTEIIEMKTDGGALTRTRIHTYNDEASLTGYINIDDKFKNKRIFKKYKGIFGFQHQKQIKENFDPQAAPEPISIELETVTELVPAPYFCENGCGGNVTDDSNVNSYENGECISQNTCKCKVSQGAPLWSGPTCEVAMCPSGCVKGECVSPGNCVCMAGYTGVDCANAICSSCSSGGQCISPGNCVCNPGQYGTSCEKKCTCVNGVCNGGQTGDGTCSVCDSGYVGANCDVSLVALCVPTIIGVILLAVCLYLLAKYFIAQTKLKAALYNNDWIVNWADLKRHDETTGRSSMFISAISMNNNTRKERKQINTGTWDGMDVHYQLLEKDSISLSDAIRLEVKQMRDMRHMNIVVFIGACIDQPNVAILTELQPKGSLDDILTNEDIKMPWNFRFALLKGICNGLDYIHKSQIKSHGRLKSSNCLVDNRWTVKLSGFGLHQMKANQNNVGDFNPHDKNNVDESKSNYGSLLWTAPEMLRTGVYHLDHVGRGTVEADCYSLGMVMSEMCTRDYPFADVMLEKSELVTLICGKKDEAIIKIWNDYIAKLNIEQGGWIRPCIKDKQWPSKYEKRKAFKKLMESCWHEDPVHRPTLKECINTIEAIEPQRGELMDHLVTMLEKYSSNLEDIVTKRTKQLTKEKQKTEDLVSRLLPKSVAEDLKQGKRVEPENFDHVTIYFSDIVGFTSIARASTPLQVVALLNDMYTAFDAISANYDVYKVETIGDAYMIVSGLPTRNGDQHAGEICTTAMDLLHAIGSFEIRHMKDTKMRLRIGIHTGNVVAGVVGLKMPRYCLFGDSVKVAESMESGGLPMRIQISETTYEILNRLGGYKTDYRDEVDVKGHGSLKRYWLRGKVGYDKELPKGEEE